MWYIVCLYKCAIDYIQQKYQIKYRACIHTVFEMF